MEELKSLKQQKDSLTSASSTLEVSLRRLEQETLPALQTKLALQEERAMVSEALLSSVRVDLSDAVKERDLQMTVVARLVTSNDSLSKSFDKQRQEIAELNDRCLKLRQMNEELVGMLGM